MELHSQGGEYWKGRAPSVIRDLVYNRFRAEAFVGMANGVCGRLGLEEGRWVQEIELTELTEVRSTVMVSQIELACFGGGEAKGALTLWDWKQKDSVVRGLDVSS